MGGLSRAVAATALCPVTLVKTRMEYGGPGNVLYRVRPAAGPTCSQHVQPGRGMTKDAQGTCHHANEHWQLSEHAPAGHSGHFADPAQEPSGASGLQSTWDALSTIVRTEGPRGLFRGVVPTVATNAPFSALYYMFYKNLQSQFTTVWLS